MPLRIVTLRLVATIAVKRPKSTTKVRSTAGAQNPAQTRKAYWGKQHGFIDTPVLEFEQFGLGSVTGPFLVDCYDTTIVVPPGCTATRGDWGNVTINIEGIGMNTQTKVDMITLGLVNNYLFSLVDEMTLTMIRTAFSPLTRDIFDFQTGFCCADGQVVIEGQGELDPGGWTGIVTC